RKVVGIMGAACGELRDRFHLLRLAELLLQMALVTHVALRAPDPHQVSMLDEADDVIKEDARPAVARQLTRFRVRSPVPGANKGAVLLAVRRTGYVVQVRQPGVKQL